MKNNWKYIAEKLLNITEERYMRIHLEVEPIRKKAKLLLLMMAQIAEFLHSNTTTEYDRKSALLYFNSDDFMKHCSLLKLDDDILRYIFTHNPKSIKLMLS